MAKCAFATSSRFVSSRAGGSKLTRAYAESIQFDAVSESWGLRDDGEPRALAAHGALVHYSDAGEKILRDGFQESFRNPMLPGFSFSGPGQKTAAERGSSKITAFYIGPIWDPVAVGDRPLDMIDGTVRGDQLWNKMARAARKSAGLRLDAEPRGPGYRQARARFANELRRALCAAGVGAVIWGGEIMVLDLGRLFVVRRR